MIHDFEQDLVIKLGELSPNDKWKLSGEKIRGTPGYKNSKVMLNSAEHEIENTNKYKTIKNQHFSGLDQPRLFILLINVQMPTIVGILIFMSRAKSIIG